MKFNCRKIENCFADSLTWEYALPQAGEEFLSALAGWEVRKNLKLRRPVFVAEKDGVVLKAALAGQFVRASFPEDEWQKKKEEFELWLKAL